MSELISGLIRFKQPVSEEAFRVIARAVSGAIERNSQEFSNQWTSLIEPRMRMNIDDAEVSLAYSEWLTTRADSRDRVPERMVLMGDIELSPVSPHTLTFCLGSRENCLTIQFIANDRVRRESACTVISEYLSQHPELSAKRRDELESQVGWNPPSAWPTNRTCFLRTYHAARDCFPVAYERFHECWLKETVEEAAASQDRVVEYHY